MCGVTYSEQHSPHRAVSRALPTPAVWRWSQWWWGPPGAPQSHIACSTVKYTALILLNHLIHQREVVIFHPGQFVSWCLWARHFTRIVNVQLVFVEGKKAALVKSSKLLWCVISIDLLVGNLCIGLKLIHIVLYIVNVIHRPVICIKLFNRMY